jgi:hypothetical protein
MNTDANMRPGGVWRGLALALGSLVLVSLVTLIMVAARLPAPEPVGEPADATTAQGATPELAPDRLRELVDAADPVAHLSRQVLGEKGEEQVERGIIVPAADTVLMRHLGLSRGVPPDIVQRFQAVALSSDPVFRREQLLALAADGRSLVRYRALLEQVRTELRLSGGRLESDARATLDAALAVEGLDGRLTVDALHLRAVWYRQEGDLDQAHAVLDRVLELDPHFLLAHWDRVAVVTARLDRAAGRRISAASRHRMVADLMRSLEHVVVLARGRNAVEDLISDTGPLRAGTEPNALFAVGYTAMLAGRVARARETLADVNALCRTANRCDQDIALAARTLLDLLADGRGD